MKNSHLGKMIAPIVIAIIYIVYFIIWFIASVKVMMLSPIAIIMGAVIPLILCLVIVHVTKQRIDEIRSGEEDDLSQY